MMMTNTFHQWRKLRIQPWMRVQAAINKAQTVKELLRGVQPTKRDQLTKLTLLGQVILTRETLHVRIVKI